MKVAVGVLVACVLVAGCAAHICIIRPHQRGNLDVSMPGSSDCYRRTPYCGGEPVGDVRAEYVQGERVEVHLQQNLNHFWPEKPGYFVLRVAGVSDPSDDDWVDVARWDDWPGNDMVWQMNFTRSFQLPADMVTPHGVLGFMYVSFNQFEVNPTDNTDAIFYNCADIAISPRVGVPPPAARPARPPGQAAHPLPSAPTAIETRSFPVPKEEYSCCTPDQWTGEATSWSSLGRLSHTVYYDATTPVVRWDRVGAVENKNGQGYQSTISYYASEVPIPEYVMDVNNQQCAEYHADGFYDWCFGPSRAMVFQGTYTEGNTTYAQWWNPTNRFYFTASVADGDVCIPHDIHHKDFHLTFTNVTAGIADSSVFDKPAFCDGATFVPGCGTSFPKKE
mmetsp:Transcript_2750/g.7601  ORF Transcript_2750/g.7601 Transcript_2750/m.7601 type:complete len:391 (+) Transcript_2750:45-1217(+)|eukprot:CAMPEP_0119132146 /NCGR_PEP_ID=MMETSP1310-20130426/11620_1 /TAXON_ID=464262 /ORGANISM="Genus nov. species nov., Strain RCC2339" /LENGTH=390 /DNA_ID=CAMNT_0007122763 /DNA_START=45 /DNA_END=1217 /DNA_ORIENTATION=+